MTDLTIDVLAARGSGWGGEVVGLVAAGVFVLFSSWIVTQRTRGKSPDRRRGHDDRKDDDG